MSITLSKFSTSQTPVVSSRGNIDSGDVLSPYSFQDWVKRNVGILPTQYVTDYNKYLQNWYKQQSNIRTNVTAAATLKEIYKNFLRQVSISFKDSEEHVFSRTLILMTTLNLQQSFH